MYPTIHYELMNARVADYHRQADRDRIARAAIQGSRARKQGRHPVAARSRIGLAVGAAAAGLALVWAIAACGSVSGRSNEARGTHAVTVSQRHARQDVPALDLVKDLAKVKRGAELRAAEGARNG